MDAVRGLGRALAGKKAGYSEGLLSDSLPELLRRATAKELLIPDVALNQQVVNTIQEEVSLGKDTREVVTLLKNRLRANKPQKQWLAVILLQKVLNDCSNVLGAHTEELLQEVARVMARPAKPETEAGKRARHAAKDLLRSFGRAGTTAFRYANNDMFPRNQIGRFGGFGNTYPAAGGYPGAYGASPTRGGGYHAYGNPGYAAGPGSPNNRAVVERETIINEVTLLIDKSRSNSELLSDMLVNSGGQGADEFENDLIKDLMKEVNELRSVFPAYLEQLQLLVGPDMEQLTMNALQASDVLDSVVTLQKDVNDNKQLPQEPAPANGAAAPPAQVQQAPAPFPAPAPAPVPAPAPAATTTTAGDLIGFDDVSNPAPPGPTTAAQDPFAASTFAPPVSPPVGGPPPMKSAFESMYLSGQQNPQMAYSAASVAAAAPLTEQQLQQQREEAARQQAAAQEEARKAQAMAQQAQLTAQQQIEMQAQQRQAQEEAQAHARYQQQLLQWQAHQASLGLSTNPGLNTDMPVLDPITNPFFDPMAEGGLLRAPAAASSNIHATPPPQPPPPMSANNPFVPQQQPQPAQQQPVPTPPQPQSTVDAEWDMFFADRSAGVQQQQAASGI
uniref:VHS domain-containing protein n=1 Tax=Dunaliella tertiolecta TaxID=3047 RepID=A0A7S3QRX5_DUNTE|mmetsp:Transcript_17056/g.47220  ORF Transcript_17056/g.47220 Transcript_17056/m.47220 type:complete len:616 (+) Transcript_17056:98-1945(+)